MQRTIHDVSRLINKCTVDEIKGITGELNDSSTRQ